MNYIKLSSLPPPTCLEQRGFTADDVTLRDASGEMAILSVQGPHVRRLLQPLLVGGAEGAAAPLDLADDDAFPV